MATNPTIDLTYINLKRSFLVSCLSIATFTIAFTIFISSVIRFPSPPFERIFLQKFINRQNILRIRGHMLELYIPRKYYGHEEVAQNVNHLNLSSPKLNAKFIPEIFDWQNNSPQINDQFHSTHDSTAKKSIYHHKNTIQLANNKISPKIKDSNWNKKDQLSINNSIAGALDHFDHDLLIFNRIPKTGSENMAYVIKELSIVNNFTHIRYGNPDHRLISRKDQAKMIYSLMKEQRRPLAYDRHVYFVDFQNFCKKCRSPLWISMARDPVQKFVSRYYYNRLVNIYPKLAKSKSPVIKYGSLSEKGWLYKNIEKCLVDDDDPECNLVNGTRHDLSIPYFCGQYSDCTVLGSQWALSRAMNNIEMHYPVVGILEDMNSTLRVLQKKLPKYFRDVIDLYTNALKDPHKNKGKRYRKLKDTLSKHLKSKLPLEYELYNFLRQRLNQQLIS